MKGTASPTSKVNLEATMILFTTGCAFDAPFLADFRIGSAHLSMMKSVRKTSLAANRRSLYLFLLVFEMSKCMLSGALPLW
ncbi:hypothetical protein DFS34DRAFT_353815 [Phlyctochytrium arcticum]|nr:hypothetical protein DFS34DRAFT_353815 [Phlyctochytrium arcticum]